MRISREKYIDAIKQETEAKVIEYNKAPTKCKFCNSSLSYDKRKNKFCSHSCSASVANIGKVRNYVNGQRAHKSCLNCGQITDNTAYCNRECCSAHIKKLKIDEVNKTGLLTGTPLTTKKYLTELRGYKCEICGCEEWNGQPVPLVLDHINGKPSDPRLDNLRLVCGNCNMQLPTFAGRNVGKGGGRPYRNQRYLEGKSW